MASCAQSYPPARRAQEPPRTADARALIRATGASALVSLPTMFFAPFIFLYTIIFFFALALLFAMLELGAINYAFNALGLPPHAAFWALIISLFGSYINIPITRIESSGGPEPSAPDVVGYFGMRYRVPAHLAVGRSTVVAINVGGAIVPLCICAWILAADPAVFLRAVL